MVTWNCCMGTDRKVPSMLEQLRPDIAVVPESSAKPQVAESSLLGDGVPHAWTGSLDHKGLGIFAPSARRMTVHSLTSTPHAIGVEVELDDRTTRVLGVWTQPARTGTWATPYMDAFASILDEYESFIDDSTIVAGDINCSAQTSPEAFPRLLDQARKRYGLRSAYHWHNGEEPGEESAMTLWWRNKEDAGFHCDVVLVPETSDVRAATVGVHAEWGASTATARSDHAPVVVDLA